MNRLLFKLTMFLLSDLQLNNTNEVQFNDDKVKIFRSLYKKDFHIKEFLKYIQVDGISLFDNEKIKSQLVKLINDNYESEVIDIDKLSGLSYSEFFEYFNDRQKINGHKCKKDKLLNKIETNPSIKDHIIKIYKKYYDERQLIINDLNEQYKKKKLSILNEYIRSTNTSTFDFGQKINKEINNFGYGQIKLSEKSDY